MTTEKTTPDGLEILNRAFALMVEAHDLLEPAKIPHVMLIQAPVEDAGHRFMGHLTGYHTSDLALAMADYVFGIFTIIDPDKVDRADALQLAQLIGKYRPLVLEAANDLNKHKGETMQ